jgi:hypothetical protein
MSDTTLQSRTRFVLRATALGVCALAMGACSLVNQRTALPRPPLELLQSDAVELPIGCIATASMRVSFTVETSGLPSEIEPSKGPACVQAALVSWVTSFRYAPRATRTPTSVEWVLASARRPVSISVR